MRTRGVLIAVGLFAVASCSGEESAPGTGGASASGGSAGGGGTAGASASGGGGSTGGEAGSGGSDAGADGAPACNLGEKRCSGDTAQVCDGSGEWKDQELCKAGCTLGICDPIACKPLEFRCYGSQVQQCDAGPPAKWVTKTTCQAASGQTCFAPTGTCVQLQPLPAPSTVGTCHVYASFAYGVTAFLGGYDIDSSGDLLYTTRSGSFLDVYQVTLQDSDGDGVVEPDQHPDNPLHQGPVEQRALTLVKTYSKAADAVPLGGSGASELYAKSDRIFTGGAWPDPSAITEYVFATKTSKVVAGVAPAVGDGGTAGGVKASRLGFGDADGRWYAGDNSGFGGPKILSWHEPTGTWVAEITTSLLGGLEVVVAPKTGQQYVYARSYSGVAYLDQYRRDPGGWTHTNRFKFADDVGPAGLGFGALDHFWITTGTLVFEVGGGDCAQYLK